MTEKQNNKQLVEAITLIADAFQNKKDADHDSLLILHVSRDKRNREKDLPETFEVEGASIGCLCSIVEGIYANMMGNEEFAILLLEVTKRYALSKMTKQEKEDAKEVVRVAKEITFNKKVENKN